MAPFDRPRYDFLLVFHCDHVAILYRFQNVTTNLLKRRPRVPDHASYGGSLLLVGCYLPCQPYVSNLKCMTSPFQKMERDRNFTKNVWLQVMVSGHLSSSASHHSIDRVPLLFPTRLKYMPISSTVFEI